MAKKKPDTDRRKLIDRLVPKPEHGPLLGVLATTFDLDAEFVETDLLPTLFGLGAWDDRSWSSRPRVQAPPGRPCPVLSQPPARQRGTSLFAPQAMRYRGGSQHGD